MDEDDITTELPTWLTSKPRIHPVAYGLFVVFLLGLCVDTFAWVAACVLAVALVYYVVTNVIKDNKDDAMRRHPTNEKRC